MAAQQHERATRRPPVRDYPAEKARQGRVVLNTRAKRIVFAAGLAGVIALAILLWLLSALDRP